MKALFSNRTRRRTVLAMLLVWEFALVSGMVNACVLDAHGSHPHDSNAHKSEIHEFPAVLFDSHSEGNLGHDDGPGIAKEGCRKVCEDGSQ